MTTEFFLTQRQYNRQKLREAFTDAPEMVAQLCRKTGLSAVSVGAILNEMVRTGEVIHGGAVPSAGGRPSATYLYNARYREVLTVLFYFDRNVTWTSFSVTDLHENCLFRKKEMLPPQLSQDWLDAAIRELLIDFPGISVIVLGMPGLLQDDGVVLQAPDGLEHYWLHLQETVGIPVDIENDINAAALGWHKRNAENEERLVGLYFPRTCPPGAGIIINGEIYHGKGGFAGEFAAFAPHNAWNNLDYWDIPETVKMISDSLRMFCCTLAPDKFVLFGDFWTYELTEGINRSLKNALKGRFEPELVFADDIEKSMCLGVTDLALTRVRQSLSRE